MRLKDLRHIFWKKKNKEEPDDLDPVYEVMDSRRRGTVRHSGDNDYEEIDHFYNDQSIAVRRIDGCHFFENQGKLRLTLSLNAHQSQLFVEEKSACEALTLTDIRDVIVTGKLSNKGCSILTNVVRCDSLKVENAAIACSFEWMYQLLQKTKEVEFINCNFEDAQIICDDLFIRNPQIIKLKILHNSKKYSFPLLTDALLRFWMQQKLEYNIQLRAATSFTIQGVECLSRMLASNKLPNTSVYVGKIVNTAEDCKNIKMPDGLQLESNGRRFFVKDKEERLFVSFDTSIPIEREYIAV